MSQWLATSKPLKYCASIPTTTDAESGVLYSTTPIMKTENIRGNALVKNTVAAEHFSFKPRSESITNIALFDDTPAVYYKSDDNIIKKLPIISDGLIFDKMPDGTSVLASLGTSSNHKNVVLPSCSAYSTSYKILTNKTMFTNCEYLTIGQSLTQNISAQNMFITCTNRSIVSNTLLHLHCYGTLFTHNAVQCTELKSAIIDHRTDVYKDSFLCPSLTSVLLNNDSYILPGAFLGAPYLEQISVQEGHPWHSIHYNILFDTISAAAISKRQALPEVVLWVPPMSVESFSFPPAVRSYIQVINNYSFSRCRGPRILYLDNLASELLIGKDAFYTNKTIEHIYVPFTSSSPQASTAPWGAVNATIHYTDTE